VTGFPSELPAPRTPDPMAAPPLRWGLIGSGWIAERFVGALQRNTRQQVLAVGSRSAERAAAFSSANAIERSYGSYDELVADPDVDVVYVATGHLEHLPGARLALEAGTPVLVEKPLGVDAAQATELAELAAARGLFCMEALWSLFTPKFDVVRRLLETGVLGEVRTVLADMGEFFTGGHRILRAEDAGGPMLDLGTYPISLATWVLGAPARILATGQPHPAGVNGQLAAILEDADGNQAVLHTTLASSTPTTATIAGTQATLILDGPFYQPGGFTLRSADLQHELTYSEPAVAHESLFYEAAEVARRIAAGERESPLRPLADSITTLRVMDEIRRQCGIQFASSE
jgi:predicted dehydrogenase